jgi:glycosyltransferase involved in cell wall biosynthesis
VFVSAFQEVAAAYADARLLVIGPDTFVRPGFEDETNQRAQAFAEGLKKRVQTVGLAGRVIFTGRSDQVPDYLRASDVFVFPSRREGFPSVVIQAMATALPCIVAELDGISADMICHGLNGYIIQGHDPSRYAERIIKILAAPAEAERIGRAARSWVEQRFRLDDVVEQYVAFCEELLSV